MPKGNNESPSDKEEVSGKTTETADEAAAPKRMIGQYRIVRRIGEGGMGVVYEAEQQNPKRPVALKVIKGGQFVDEHSVKLFQREAQALARLRHSGIAAIYETGRTDEGQHFFAMELVRGMPLLDYLRSQRMQVPPGSSELKEHLRLFCKICEAVNYAHQRGVIHRDLKPSNILVSTATLGRGSSRSIALPEIKILDFGLARITDADVAASTLMTDVGQIQGTLAYMSPEQARGNPDEIDLRSDVYSLGIILFELLTGQLPYVVQRSMPHEAIRAICFEEPRTPSKLESTAPRPGKETIDRDLDTIALKALEKDAGRRYQSALALAEDIERYLSDQPILARPPSTVYQVRKLVARHKAAFAFAGALFVLITSFAVAMTIQSARIARERDNAVTAQQTAWEVSRFLVDLFKISDPGEARGSSITAREILDKGAERIPGELEDQPRVQATLMDTMGTVYLSLGLYDKASSLLEDALAKRRALLGNEHLEVAQSLNNIGVLLEYKGDYGGAEQMHREALAMRRKLLGDSHKDVAASLNNLASVLAHQGKIDEAEQVLRESLDMHRELLGEVHADVATLENNLALFLSQRGNYEEAEQLYRRSLATRRRLLGERHPALAASLNNLGMLLYRTKNYDGAEPLLKEALEVNRTILGDEHPEVANNINNLALVYRDKGDLAAAEPLLRESLAMRQKLLGENHPTVLSSMQNLAYFLSRKGEYEEAASLFTRVINIQRKSFPEDHWEIATTKNLLGDCLTAWKKYEEAEPLLLNALAVIEKQFGDTHPRTQAVLRRIITLYEAWDKPQKAAEYRALMPQ